MSKRRLSTRYVLVAVVGLACLAVPLSAAAQGAYGTSPQDFWVPAMSFAAADATGAGRWTNMGFSYYANAGLLPEFFLAAVDLPAGAHVTDMECSFNDTSGTTSAEVKLQKSLYVVGTGPSQTTLATVASSGSGGYQEVATTLNETLRYHDGNDRIFWYLSADMPGDLGVRIRGCRLTWNRQITPAPVAATFNDVGTNHQLFQYVEALVAAGITSGCGNNNYCPDAFLTRGQMAVFLSRLAGLHWPN